MRTNIVVDDDLMESARRLGGFKTKRETVQAALKLFVMLKEQEKIRDYRGKLDREGDLEAMRRDR